MNLNLRSEIVAEIVEMAGLNANEIAYSFVQEECIIVGCSGELASKLNRYQSRVHVAYAIALLKSPELKSVEDLTVFSVRRVSIEWAYQIPLTSPEVTESLERYSLPKILDKACLTDDELELVLKRLKRWVEA